MESRREGLLKRMTASVLMLMVVLLFQSCATEVQFANSAIVPGAEGSVKIKNDKNQNYTIDLNVIRLAEPGRLDPAKAMYIVWMETGQGAAQNIGQLKTSSGFLSKSLTSSLRTVSSFKPVGFFITAENSAAIQYPGTQVVLKTGLVN